jgi:hypothetical protein
MSSSDDEFAPPVAIQVANERRGSPERTALTHVAVEATTTRCDLRVRADDSIVIDG